MHLECWISDTNKRFFPLSPGNGKRTLSGDFALNERFSFQVLLRSDFVKPIYVKISSVAPDGWKIRIRRIGYVPVRHANTPFCSNPEDADYGNGLPGYVPDALIEAESMEGGEVARIIEANLSNGRRETA